MADVNRGDRPLSPHASIYRWPLNSIMSILHRATGTAMTLAAVLIVWWFLAAATSPEYFAMVDGLLTSWLGDLVFFGSLLALWFHFFNGIRHLIWDTGAGFDDENVTRTAIGALVLAAVLTVITLIAI
ncbi:succinate dehydrogenase, cytochrome b556 subunit [Maritimibacter sp. 55A14]|uniref:succinate dehydrogenase, cytochrome b556 subunit n=1 Tax=Maritimibacter sp. 55A14 TaxID=2174844 RepID=UPI000D609D16|nr:succinate dehydrogenase, cytochrome b556 subunit [Maritimibacter sp. 55A14]PWE29261.1 succinate dehydrogenase, cytochrome b556 subunit [Maritimibacter sp. 55A14]